MGNEGDGDGQFVEPSDIAIDKQNNVFVVDYRSRVVQKFDEDGSFLLRWGSTGITDGAFAGIYSVAIDPAGNVLIADESGRIQKFDGNGKFLAPIPLEPLDKIPIDPWNIAIDIQGNIYVADNGGTRIVKLDSQGKVLATWRGKETGAEMFNSLQDIAVDGQGNIYITDSATNILQKFRQPEFLP